VVDLVTHQLHAGFGAPRRDGGKIVGRDHGSGRIGGAGDHHALDGWADLGEHLHGRLEPGVRPARHLDHLTAQRGEDVSVTGITRAGHGNPVTDVETRQERQQEPAGGPGGDDDVVGLDRDAIPVGVRGGDGLAQLRDPQRDGVPEGVVGQGLGRRGTDRRRRLRARLPGRQVHQVAVRTLPLGGGKPHVHHVERRNSGP
jgi:hypothetical protein